VSKVEFVCICSGGLDELLFDGPLIQVEITAPLELVHYLDQNGLPRFPVMQGLAQIDTGAAVSAVDTTIFERLEIPAVERSMVQTAHGLFELDRYNASISFPQFDLAPMPLQDVVGGQIRHQSASGGDVIMLVGRDLLQYFSFHYDGRNSRFTVITS